MSFKIADCMFRTHGIPCCIIQDQMAQEIRARLKEMNRKRPAPATQKEGKKKKYTAKTPTVGAVYIHLQSPNMHTKNQAWCMHVILTYR